MKTENDKQLILQCTELLRQIVEAVYEGAEPKPQSYDDFTATYRRYTEGVRKERPAVYLTGKDFGTKRQWWRGECPSCGRPTYGWKYCADCSVMRGG